MNTNQHKEKLIAENTEFAETIIQVGWVVTHQSIFYFTTLMMQPNLRTCADKYYTDLNHKRNIRIFRTEQASH